MVRSSPQQFIEEKKKRRGGLEEGRAGECRLHGKRGRDKKGAESIARMRRAKGKGARAISGISVLHFQGEVSCKRLQPWRFMQGM